MAPLSPTLLLVEVICDVNCTEPIQNYAAAVSNLASDDTIHGYQTCSLLQFCLNGCNVLFAESGVEDCLELNFRYADN